MLCCNHNFYRQCITHTMCTSVQTYHNWYVNSITQGSQSGTPTQSEGIHNTWKWFMMHAQVFFHFLNFNSFLSLWSLGHLLHCLIQVQDSKKVNL